MTPPSGASHRRFQPHLRLPSNGTYTGDPPPGLTARGTFLRAELGQGGFSWSGLRRFAVVAREGDGADIYVVGHPLVDEFLCFAAGRARPNTVRAYAHDLKTFFTVVAKDPSRSAPRTCSGFITAQRRARVGAENVVRISDGGSGLSDATIRRRLAAVSAFYGYLIARGDLGVETTRCPGDCPRVGIDADGRGQPLVRAVRRLPRILEPDELAALLAALRTQRDRAMVQAMVLGGLRRARCSAFASRICTWASGECSSNEGKGGHQRLVPVSPSFFATVAAYMDTERPCGLRHRSCLRGVEGATPGPAALGRGAR